MLMRDIRKRELVLDWIAYLSHSCPPQLQTLTVILFADKIFLSFYCNYLSQIKGRTHFRRVLKIEYYWIP